MTNIGRQVVVKNCQGNDGSFRPGIARAGKVHSSWFVLLAGLTRILTTICCGNVND